MDPEGAAPIISIGDSSGILYGEVLAKDDMAWDIWTNQEFM